MIHRDKITKSPRQIADVDGRACSQDLGHRGAPFTI
jgi:hypothetical protein